MRSTAIFTPSPPGRGQGEGQLCMERTMKDNKIDLREGHFMQIDFFGEMGYNK